MNHLFSRIVLAVSLIIASYVATLPEPHQPLTRPLPDGDETARAFSIIVLPDTQFYSMSFPEIFMAQTAWIAEHKKNRNIVFVSQEGDIVQTPDIEAQWQIADAAMQKLDGVVPYGLAPGNHDIAPGGNAPLYQKYFPLSRLKRSQTWGGSYLNDNPQPHDEHAGSKNSFQLFNGGGAQYIAFNLEFCPPDPVIDWVGDTLTLHPNRRAIITTHSFTDFRGERSNSAICRSYGGGGDNAGEEIWQKLVVDQNHLNLSLFLSGHDITSTHGAARRTDIIDGHPVHQMLANYQQLGNGGNGFLRILTFQPTKRLIQVETYSPYLNEYMADPENQFQLRL